MSEWQPDFRELGGLSDAKAQNLVSRNRRHRTYVRSSSGRALLADPVIALCAAFLIEMSLSRAEVHPVTDSP